ncbi:cytochrome c oxidase subunit II [Waterburya agarophytonicola K14]|uniref:Cytochrome c oxidase subunit 2 n=2 Tax=Waterburya TaxID=2886915 RepID=A0A964BSL3_9CYAN|nr:cytochrome c oxidase subunit II [Waterburya agarophytonicola]MCC0178404.1 cytochrome c oxidase subunit II [Waterburya agarophytonicola KI4]
MGRVSYSWFPPQASAEAILYDDLFSILTAIGTFIFLGVTLAIGYNIIFHRAGRYDTSDGPPIEGNLRLEILWTVTPLLIVIGLAAASYQTYDKMNLHGATEIAHLPQVMESAYADTGITTEPMTKIEVDSKQWAWVFRYPEKNVTSTELHLPVDQRAHLKLRSQDVIHGFYIPAFRVKQDIIPAKTIDFEFTPIREGKYRLRDSQYSGTYFAAMQADVVVESPEDYDRWLNQAAKQTPTPAPNQAASEYAKREQKEDSAGWQTVVPAPAPMVNYHP